jgi:hypothetical protein
VTPTPGAAPSWCQDQRGLHDAGKVHVGMDETYLFGRRRISGPDPEHGSYRSLASFSDPDGNGWLLQEVKPGFQDVGSAWTLLQ